MALRKASMWSRCSTEAGECAKHRERADDEYPRIRSHLPRLQLRPEPSQRACEERAAVDEQPVDEADVHALPEHVAGRRDGGPHDGDVVAFVHVVLVLEDLLDAVRFGGV